MNKKISNIQEIKENIKDSDLFELRFNKDYPELTESINSISFGNEQSRIYLLITDFGHTVKPDIEGKLKVYDYNLDLSNLNDYFCEGLKLMLYDRNGNILHNFEFIGCILEDIAEQKLNYNIDDKFKSYIISISYCQIYKI